MATASTAANVAYLSGYDPRFEETLLVILPGSTPKLLVGNEGWGYAEFCAGPYERVLYQSFSLPAQPRDRSPALAEILADCGLKSGQRIGAIGWKPFSSEDPASTKPRSTCPPSSPTHCARSPASAARSSMPPAF